MKYDVLVIGSGTAGCYFARKMAEQGYRVCVADAAPARSLGRRLELFHIDKDTFGPLGVPMPRPGDDDYISEFAAGTYYPPDGQYMKRDDGTEKIVYAEYPFLVCRLPRFIRRLRAWCAEAGVEFLDEAAFVDLVYCEHGVRGAKLLQGGEEKTVYARLVADCSGLQAVARRRLRKPTPVEDFEVRRGDLMHVLLHYVKLAHPERDAPRRAEHWAYYKGWIAQAPHPGEAVVGVGADTSFAYAELCMRRFKEAVAMPEGEVAREQRGVVPYHRAPYSLVDDGFVVLGDAACMNKWIGEGITSGWVGCRWAAEVAGLAMRGGAYPTRAALWPFNVQYNTTQAANFAYIVATSVNAVDCSAAEMQYEFERGIVFNDKAMTRLNRDWNAEMPPDEALALAAKVAGGVVTGHIRPRTVRYLLKGIACATLLKAHYQKFPLNPAGYGRWAARCDALWKACGTLSEATQRCEERMREGLQ